MNKQLKFNTSFFILVIIYGCSITTQQPIIQDVKGTHQLVSNQIWLTHEHILVDFIGADSIQPNSMES